LPRTPRTWKTSSQRSRRSGSAACTVPSTRARTPSAESRRSPSALRGSADCGLH